MHFQWLQIFLISTDNFLKTLFIDVEFARKTHVYGRCLWFRCINGS